MHLFHLDMIKAMSDPALYFKLVRPSDFNDYTMIVQRFKAGDLYHHVADVETDDPEDVFGLTQDDWSLNPEEGVKPVNGRQYRSTTSGDIIVDDECRVHVVAPFGVRVFFA